MVLNCDISRRKAIKSGGYDTRITNKGICQRNKPVGFNTKYLSNEGSDEEIDAKASNVAVPVVSNVTSRCFFPSNMLFNFFHLRLNGIGMLAHLSFISKALCKLK